MKKVRYHQDTITVVVWPRKDRVLHFFSSKDRVLHFSSLPWVKKYVDVDNVIEISHNGIDAKVRH